jgi:hypothetical protein
MTAVGIGTGAAILAASQAHAMPPQDPPRIAPQSIQLTYGHGLVVHGTASTSDAGHTIALEFTRPGQSAWRRLSSATIGAGGDFRLAGTLTQSGAVRAVDTSSGAPTPLLARVMGASRRTASVIAPVPVEVVARVRVPSRQIAVLGGQAIRVRGRLLPAHAGRKVSLQAQDAGRWRTLTTTRTGSAGGFVLRYVAAGPGRQHIRVRFDGDRLNGRSTTTAGQLTVYREAGASWYFDGGNTACGFHAQYGVANRTLPCGTMVALRYNGRSVIATVDDRGPYVGGRDWDLNQNTAGALGFGGVGTVWSSQ